MNYPTSKRPNPTKYHPNNRCLIPSHPKKTVRGNRVVLQTVADRRPGEIIKSNDGKFTYQMQQNWAIVKVQTPR
jgi:hypothetical protein